MDNSEKLEQYDYSSESDYFETAVIEYSSYIGEFFMEFSLLEHILNIKIAGVIHHGTHEIGYQVMENMSMKNKIDLFVRLYNNIEESLDKKEKNKLLNIKTILNAINEFRNSLAHAYWYSIQTNWSVRMRFISDQELGNVFFKKKIIKPKDIKLKIKELKKLISDLEKYRQDFS